MYLLARMIGQFLVGKYTDDLKLQNKMPPSRMMQRKLNVVIRSSFPLAQVSRLAHAARLKNNVASLFTQYSFLIIEWIDAFFGTVRVCTHVFLHVLKRRKSIHMINPDQSPDVLGNRVFPVDCPFCGPREAN